MKPLTNFLKRYPNGNSLYVKRSALISFLDCIYGRPDGVGERVLDLGPYDELADKYLIDKDRKLVDDLIDYINFLYGEHEKSPSSIRIYVSAVKVFLVMNDIELSRKQEMILRGRFPKGSIRKVPESPFTTDDIKVMLHHADTKLRSIILILTSSGMRIGELLSLTQNDMNLNTRPYKVIIRPEYTKTGDGRITFISHEAKEALDQWMNVRDDYLSAAQYKNAGLIEAGKSGPKKENDNRIFPISYSVVLSSWTTILEKSGIVSKDERSGKLDRRIHGLRKYFRTKLATIQKGEVAEVLMGHEGYLTEAYRVYPEEDLRDIYQKDIEFTLTIYQSDITDELKEQKDKLEETKTQLDKTREENIELITHLSKRVLDVETENHNLRSKLDTVISIIERFGIEEKYGYKQSLQDDLEKLRN